MIVPENSIKRIANEGGCGEPILGRSQIITGHLVWCLLGKACIVGPVQNGLDPGLLCHCRREDMKKETIGLCRNSIHSTEFIPLHPILCARPSLALYMHFLTELSKQPYRVTTGFTPSVLIRLARETE